MRIATLFPLLALAVAAAPLPASAELKLGYVDFAKALGEVDEGKVAKAQLKKDFDEKQKRIDKEQEDLKRMMGDFEKQAPVMAEEARRDRAAELDRKRMEVQSLFMQLQKELSDREQQTTSGIFQKMSQIVAEIAEAEGITMVFDQRQLVYAPSSLDITNELVRKYNGRFKPGAEAASAKKEPKKNEPEKKAGKK